MTRRAKPGPTPRGAKADGRASPSDGLVWGLNMKAQQDVDQAVLKAWSHLQCWEATQ